MAQINCYLVDDQRDVLDRMESLLSHISGINLLGKETLPELAVEEIVKSRPDIVFTDVEMPGMTGFELIEEVRRRKCNPIFIFVTGYNQYAIKAIKNSAFDFLLKPVDIDELKETIARYNLGNTMNKEETSNDIIPGLSEREREVLVLIVQGKTSKIIASELFISKTTVDTHRKNILSKTECKSTPELIKKALESNWI